MQFIDGIYLHRPIAGLYNSVLSYISQPLPLNLSTTPSGFCRPLFYREPPALSNAILLGLRIHHNLSPELNLFYSLME